MKTDDFEKRLQHVPQRQVPDSWRTEILANVKANTAPREETDSILALLRKAFLLFIHRPRGLAWSGVGAAWILILMLNFSAREGTNSTIAQSMPSIDTMHALQKQKQFLLAELNGATTSSEAIPPKPPTVGPRSNRKPVIFSA